MTHDLHNYMSQLSAKMDAEYARIRKTASSDPGTAGDEGEENWAQLLREWLPRTYSVVTKGQLIDAEGSLSPQIDVIVLKPSYPAALHHKKKYFIAGVAAAFECKLTLKKAHIDEGVRTGAAVKRLAGAREGTPYKELVNGPVFGIVAHAHSWKTTDGATSAISTIDQHLNIADLNHVKHPREIIDLLCVSNLATWVASKQPLFNPEDEINDAERAKLDPKGVPSTAYMCHAGRNGFFSDTDFNNFSPIGVFVSELLVKLAWEDPSLRDIASYFLGVEFSRTSIGKSRYWSRDIYSLALKRKLSHSKLTNVIGWDEWATSIE